MKLILKVFLISFFVVGLEAFALTVDYVSAFKPNNKIQTLSEFQKSLNSDLYKTRRKIMTENKTSMELATNKNPLPSKKF